jgi:hypothetical protein
MQRNPCPWYPECPIPFRGREHESCVCPCVSATNIVYVARRAGQPTVRVPTAFSPACERAAREAGLGEDFRGIPLREVPRFDVVRKYGQLAPGVDDSIWDRLHNLYELPEYLTVDVDRTIVEGRVVAARRTTE